MADYTLPCTEQGDCFCRYIPRPFPHCVPSVNNCNCNCPPPLPNSHQVANNCGVSAPTCAQIFPTCPCTCDSPACSGTCDYDCDVGFHWNGVACVPDVVAKKLVKGDGLVWLVMQH